MATPDQQKQLQALSDEYTALQTELQTTVAARQKLESQQQENKGVKSLVGPILLKQDASEAKSTVDGRLEFIDKEMCKQISDIQAKSEEKKMAVFQLQTDIQQSGQPAT
ncbi:unnamed protein product [Aureobasidium vineae]|uniref:Prefoldin subunit 6 n=1 Tax=Aureobasidium vineae TaxID=2773715 RepID=A0A9N8K1G4_9PEZI|nr:unnamed protein product [Aureobasidium vineae]